jgi:endonuclease G
VNRPPHSKAELAGKPVARILDANSEGAKKGFGSGFLISENLFMTNFHVFPDIDYAEECLANFNYEYDAAGNLKDGSSFKLEPGTFFLNDPNLDFAIVAIAKLSEDKLVSTADIGFIQMIETPGKVIKGDDINIIQYPLGGNKQYACKQNHVVQIFDDLGYIQYITDTAKASSGSPCYNKFWELAALHHCAIPEVKDKKIVDTAGNPWNGRDQDDIRWVANEGISISKIVAYLKMNAATFPMKNIQLLDRVLGTVRDPLFNESAKPITNLIDARANETNDMANFTFNFYGPTTINIGSTKSAQGIEKVIEPVLTPAKRPGEEASAIKFDEDYDSRNELGYQESFLEGFDLAEPKVNDVDKLKELHHEDGEPYVFKYYNYSLVMNKKRRFCMWTAVNVNYDKNVRSTKSREDFGRDTWRRDPRLADNLQVIGTELYAPAKRVEQGHIVRREDACWGESAEFIEFANSDTFHYTNCTPQLEPFNRANPRKSQGYEGIHGIWGALEEHIKTVLKNVDNKAVIFAGPYLSAADPSPAFVDNNKIKIPMKFWKVVCVLDEGGKLFSYGFWLDQKDVYDQFGTGVGEEALDFRKFKKQQIRISEITEKTKVVFDDKIYNTDVLKNNAFNESDGNAVSYSEVNEIQVLPK